MSTVGNPYQDWNIVADSGIVQNAPQKVLFIGQQATDATVTPGEIVENIDNSGQENLLFGRRSMISTMVRTFKRYNPLSQLDVLPLADPTTGPVEASATITLTGTATQATTLRLFVQSRRYFVIEIGISPTEGAEAVATRIDNAISANNEILVTSTHGAGVVTLTAVHPGTDGNFIKLGIIDSIPGIDIVITPFTGGAGAVESIDFATVIGERRYQTLGMSGAYSTNVINLRDYLISVFNAPDEIKDGVGFIYTAAAPETLAATLDTQTMCVFGEQVTNTSFRKGGFIDEYDPTITAYFCAVRALRLTSGANIAQYLVGSGITNTTGGVFRAATPYHQTPFVDIATITNGQGYSKAIQQLLNSNGVSFFGNNQNNSEIVVGDVVTTYLTDAGGNPDLTFKYLNTVDTISAIREFFFNNSQIRFAQTVLTDGDITGPGRMANVQSIRSFYNGLYQTLGGANFGLVQAGSTSQRFFNDNLQIALDILTGTVTISCAVLLVGQLRAINGTIIPRFSITTN